MANLLRLRLLQDIAELQTKPYPNIALHIQDEDISTGCLVLTTDGYGAMHLTINFTDDYPLIPPKIRMDSKITHPNIKEAGHICASILDTEMDYTSAYTLKGIAIQLLSFFSSDRIQQLGGDFFFELEDFRNLHVIQNADTTPHVCNRCFFGTTAVDPPENDVTGSLGVPSTNGGALSSERRVPFARQDAVRKAFIQKSKLPGELFLMIFDFLETEDLLAFAEAWPPVAKVITEYNVIRTRELQCFCLKKNYNSAKLGVGVAITAEEKGNRDFITSEFDVLSEDAYELGVERSVQGVPFQYWLPLPLSRPHWERVKDDANASLDLIARKAGYSNLASEYILFKMMNDIMVKLSKEVERTTYRSPVYPYEEKPVGTLTYASDKAIDSYFHIFHLLLCKATIEPAIVDYTNKLLSNFANGLTSKEYVSNIGHVLVATLISDVDITKKMIQNLIIEAATRNVIRVLQKFPELAYLEPTPISEYRLAKTFEASKTSYRILMFLNLFRRTAVGTSVPRKTIQQLCDNAFERHGAPPPGGAKYLADSIKEIHSVDNFGDFFSVMDMPDMGKEWFTKFLRERITDAIGRGYCGEPLTQEQAMTLRSEREGGVEVLKGKFLMPYPKPGKDGIYNFSPNRGRGRGGARGGRGGRGGRGRGR